MPTINLTSKDTFTSFQLLDGDKTKLSFTDLSEYDEEISAGLYTLYNALAPSLEGINIDHVATAAFKDGVFNTLYTFRLLNVSGKATLTAGGNSFEMPQDLKVGNVEFELKSVAAKTPEGKDTTIAQLECDVDDYTFVIPVALAKGIEGATLKRAHKKGSEIVEFLGLPPARPMRMEDLYRTSTPDEMVDPAPTYLFKVLGVKQGAKGDYGYSYTIQIDPAQLPSEIYDRTGQKIDDVAAFYAKGDSSKLLQKAFEGESKTMLSKIQNAISENRCYLKVTGYKKMAGGYSVFNSLQILPTAPTEAPKEEVAVPM